MACSQDSFGPDAAILVGAFGSAVDPAELLATRVGVQLNLGCGGYFISRDPLHVDSAGSFRVHGTLRPDGALYIGPLMDAVITGLGDAASASADMTLQVEGGSPQAPVHYVLHEGTSFQGSLVCPQ
jgi:hypothetical protein